MKSCLEVIPESIQLVKMDDSTYFSEEYSDYISNSKLSLADPDLGGSLEKFEAGIVHKYSESLELGNAIHAMLLQPDSYYISEINKPSGKLGVFVEDFYKQRKAGKDIMSSIKEASESSDYYKNKLSEKRLSNAIKESIDFYLKRIHLEEDLEKTSLFLSKSMADKHKQCMLSISNNNQFKKALYFSDTLIPVEYYNECALLCEVKVLGKIVKVKAKLDNFTINYDDKIITLNDVKSTSKPINYFMGNNIYNELGEKVWIKGSFEKYKYYRQIGMYLWLLQAAMANRGLHDFKYKANILVIETVPEYKTAVFAISKKWINKGLQEFKKLLILVTDGPQ